MLKEFSGDFRLLRIVMASSDPIETWHNIKMGRYSIRTVLDMLEMLDVQETIREEARIQSERERAKKGRKP